MRITIDTSDITRGLSAELDAEVAQSRVMAQEIALDFHASVVRKTPVDTGVARSGWTVDTGSIPSVENRVEYIGRLNDGHSKQAPAGFVEAALDAVMAKRR